MTNKTRCEMKLFMIVGTPDQVGSFGDDEGIHVLDLKRRCEVTEPIESLRRELAADADTTAAIRCIDNAGMALFTGCLAAVIGGNLDLANDIALGLKSLKSAIEFLEKTRERTRVNERR